MLSSAFIPILIALFFGSRAASADTRIVGGENTDILHHPHQVSLRLFGGHFCGGSIIGKKHILTAAHCVEDKLANRKHILANTGSSYSQYTDGKSYSVRSIAIHADWTGNERDARRNDIAVLTLTTNIVFNDRTKKIKLASKRPKLGDKAIVTGWGIDNVSNPNVVLVNLQKANMTVLTVEECRKFYDGNLYAGQICAQRYRGVGACMGDSGGPLVVADELVGVVSWGIPCGRGVPDVYTSVYYYQEWIKQRMNGAISVAASVAVLILCALIQFIY